MHFRKSDGMEGEPLHVNFVERFAPLEVLVERTAQVDDEIAGDAFGGVMYALSPRCCSAHGVATPA